MSIDITVTGRLTKDPELRKTQSGKLVTSFGLAHNFRERAGNQFKDVVTVFFDASVREEDGATEVAELGLTKGARVTVEGVWSKRTGTTKASAACVSRDCPAGRRRPARNGGRLRRRCGSAHACLRGLRILWRSLRRRHGRPPGGLW
jgi:single-stranded DNA-binding protein